MSDYKLVIGDPGRLDSPCYYLSDSTNPAARKKTITTTEIDSCVGIFVRAGGYLSGFHLPEYCGTDRFDTEARSFVRLKIRSLGKHADVMVIGYWRAWRDGIDDPRLPPAYQHQPGNDEFKGLLYDLCTECNVDFDDRLPGQIKGCYKVEAKDSGIQVAKL